MAEQVGSEEFHAALPDMHATITVQGLEQSIEIFRDQLGIPHVRANTLRDAFFGQGFAQAQDRLWQMHYDRLRAAGQSASVVGKAGLAADMMMRKLDLIESAQADYEAFDADTKAVVDAYAAGVNAFINTTKTLPIEFRLLGLTPHSWQPWDSGAIFKVRHVLMGVWGLKLWRARVLKALGPEMVTKIGQRATGETPLMVPPGAEYHLALASLDDLIPSVEALTRMPEAAGSNTWAIAGARTRSGKPLLAGDPHRLLDVPNVYYQNHVACPEFDVVGFSFAGIPGFPHFAHNQHVAWCITHASADYQDLYIEHFRPAGDGYEYEFDGEWRPAQHREESITVRGGEPVTVRVTSTHHGPVVIGDPANGYAMTLHYSALDRPNLGFTCLLPQMRATTVAELDESMRNWVDPCNNLTMGDVHGTIGYLHRGRVPMRAKENGWLPVPGWSSEYEWHGDIPFEELPRVINPATNWIGTANNRITNDDYPHYLSNDYSPPYRAMQLFKRLAAVSDATVDDMLTIHADRTAIPARWFIEALGNVTVDDATTEQARQRLLAWNAVMDKDAVPPTLYAVARDELTKRIVGNDLLAALASNPYPEEPAAMSPAARLWSNILIMLRAGDTSLLDGKTWPALLSEALTRAVASLREQLGDDMDTWQWGRLHMTRPAHPLAGVFPELAAQLNPPAVSIGGDADTLQAAGTFPGQSFYVNGTSVSRYVFDLSDWANSRWVSPLGASGHPGSPHYADQAVAWSDVQTHPMLYDWETIAAQAETHQQLRPE